jgi:hypothetical protein
VILRADFGWIILVAFVFWVLQVLRAGATGKGGRGGPIPGPPSGTPEGTQREGVELERLLRHLERRLGEAGERAGPPRTKVTIKRPAPGPSPATVEVADGRSLEVAEDRTLAAAIDRQRLIPTAASQAPPSRATSGSAAAPAVSARQLRDAVLWQEILGPPKGLQ